MDSHTYFVGKLCVWVHNECTPEQVPELISNSKVALINGQYQKAYVL